MSASSTRQTRQTRPGGRLLVCVRSRGAEDLQALRIYRRVPDAAAEARGLVRVVDDSGADRLYLVWHFLPLPPEFERQVLARLGPDER
jgi:hypothetical protein